ncbi:MAG: patatin-like phospholipase family protein, partial [Solirubrobacterales bacterium]
MGLVLAGGGARGAYEAGVLSVLQPALEAEQARPSVVVGTSVGAINAAQVAAGAQLPAAEGSQNALDSWAGINKGDVIRPILTRQAPLTFVRYAGEILSLPGVRLPSLLDPGPLDRNLKRWIDWPALHANVANGLIRSVAVVATATTTGRTVAFVESKGEQESHPTHAVDYSPAHLTPDHIRASAAIPILFPPVELEDDRGHRGWYVDGGTRLNAPIKPALDLGAERLVIIATGAITPPDPPGDADADRQPPDFGDGALHLLEGALVDPLVEDLHRLGRINTFLSEGGAEPMRRFRSARGQRPYNRVPFIFVAPERQHAIGELARTVFEERYRGVRGLRSPDMRFLNRLIGGDSPSHGELLSYLLFDAEFMRELIAMGQADAKRCLAGSDGKVPWRYR